MRSLTNVDVIDLAIRHREETGPVLSHSVKWNADAWRRALPEHRWIADTIDNLEANEPTSISRGEVARFAGDPQALFIASNIWGYGLTGYGPSRVAAIINKNKDLASRLAAIASAAAIGPSEAWVAITKDQPISGFGVAFGTKFAYFASLTDPSLDPRPLIADLNTSWALWHVAEVRRSVEQLRSYMKYIEYTHHRDFSDFAPDEIEWALFELGKSVTKSL